MDKIFISLLLCLFFIVSCGKEENNEPDIPIDYQYQIDIQSPEQNQITSKGDTLMISVLFKSQTDEIVHYINVSMYDKSNPDNMIYEVEAHMHVEKQFLYEDTWIIKDNIITTPETEWICKAKVWSHDIDPEIISDSLQFFINP
jgi:hypothetical protein